MADEGLKPKRIEDWPDDSRWAYNGSGYLTLSGVRLRDHQETLTFRFGMSLGDRLRALIFGDVYVSVITFGDPLQPLRVELSEPDFISEARKGRSK